MEILKRPIITEKMTKLGEKLNRYGFVVDRKANKLQVKTAVEKMYGVTVKAVNTMVIPGKTEPAIPRQVLQKVKKALLKKLL